MLCVCGLLVPEPFWGQDQKHELKGIELKLTDTLSQDPFPGLDSSLNGYKVFFTGEDHTFTNSNILLELNMMKYLHKKANMRIHLLEFGTSVGWLVDQYVQSGDSMYLAALKDYSYRNFAPLFKGLREFNATLDSANKIRVVGIDLEWSFSTSSKVLSLLLKDSLQPDSEIALAIEAIKGMAEYVTTDYNGRTAYGGGFGSLYSGNFNLNTGMRDVMNCFYKHKEKFMKCVAREPEMFEKIMNGIKEWERWDEYEDKRMIQGTYFREQYMYDRFMEVMKKNPNVSFYGQFGRCHVAREEQREWCNSYMFNAVASRMNNSPDPRLRKKVFTIGIYYPNAHRTVKGKFAYGYEQTEEERKLSAYLPQDRRSGLFMYRIKSDTVLTRIMGERFQYIILNFSPNDPKDGETDKIEPKKYYYNEMFYHADGFYQFHHVKTEKLFSFLNTSGFTLDETRMTQAGGGFTFSEDDYQTIMLHYTHILPMGFTDSAGNKGRISGYNFMFRLGKEIGPRNWFQASPYIGLGFGNLKLSFSDVNNNSGVFGGTYFENYSNPAMLVDAGADVRANLGFISLGLRGGYMIDTSDKGWKAGDEFIDGAPRTGMSGFYYGVNVSLFLRE